MSFSDLPFKSAAVVIWLPKGAEPTAEDFAIGGDEKAKAPPFPNPEAWWELGQALIHVRTADLGNHGKLPWVKAGEKVLSPDDCLKAYEAFKTKNPD